MLPSLSISLSLSNDGMSEQVSLKDPYDLGCPWRPSWYLWSMLLPQAVLIAEVLVEVCVLYYWWRPCQCLLPMILPKAMVMSMVYSSPGGHVEVYGPCYHWRPCECHWSVLPSEAMLIEVDNQAVVNHGLAVWFCWLFKAYILFLNFVCLFGKDTEREMPCTFN